MRVINAMNQSFRECFYSEEFNRLCRASISQGEQRFAHEMSAFWFRSGFKISIENDNGLGESEMKEIADNVLCNTSFVRQLMALGFDTLVIQGKTNEKTCKFSLKKYANLNNYYIGG
jgi:hypothetical protein